MYSRAIFSRSSLMIYPRGMSPTELRWATPGARRERERPTLARGAGSGFSNLRRPRSPSHRSARGRGKLFVTQGRRDPRSVTRGSCARTPRPSAPLAPRGVGGPLLEMRSSHSGCGGPRPDLFTCSYHIQGWYS
jgi:hypothetical protein